MRSAALTASGASSLTSIMPWMTLSGELRTGGNFMDGTTQVGTSALNGTGVAALSTSSLTAGTHHLSAVYAGDGNFIASTSTVVSLASDFSLSASSLSPSAVSPVQLLPLSIITITPLNGFDSAKVTLACSIAPSANPAATCSFGSISMANGTGKATATLSTSGSSAALVPGVGMHSSEMLLAFALVIPAIFLGISVSGPGQQRKLLSFVFIFLLLGACVFQLACGGGAGAATGGAQTGTPTGSYTITITGTANGVQHNTSVNLTVK